MDNEITQEYRKLREKHPNYRLMKKGEDYGIYQMDRILKKFYRCRGIREQPLKGLFAIIGLGHKEYTDREWAIREYISYIYRINREPTIKEVL